ncbi:hypothetical protein CXB51_019983 [Gossypium anomalum]|uniref:Uncharacterized protein n=1 Tax=Gossypium anomalum TaxID=47600 RepID=A0A8J5YJ47_9ROSI|nr:hypothetical protein CXB51_019983 [Gossypium anomalum]
MPKTLALSAVQRQTAASRSARPWRREQHGCTGGEPTVTLTKPSTSAQTPNLRVSCGHLPEGDGEGVGFGFGLGEGQEPQALTREKKRTLRAKKRASNAVLFEAILPNVQVIVWRIWSEGRGFYSALRAQLGCIIM